VQALLSSPKQDCGRHSHTTRTFMKRCFVSRGGCRTRSSAASATRAMNTVALSFARRLSPTASEWRAP